MFHSIIRTNQEFFYTRIILRSRKFNMAVWTVILDLANVGYTVFFSSILDSLLNTVTILASSVILCSLSVLSSLFYRASYFSNTSCVSIDFRNSNYPRTRKDTFDVKPIFFIQDTSVPILQMIPTLRFWVESQAGSSLYQFFQAQSITVLIFLNSLIQHIVLWNCSVSSCYASCFPILGPSS